MITNNYKNFLSCIFCNTSSNVKALLPITNYSGTTRYCSGTSGGITSGLTLSFSTSSNVAGVIVGSDDTQPTENDYTLSQLISSGLSATISHSKGIDNNGSPYITITLTLTNTSNSEIIVKEIGLNQSIYTVPTTTSTSASATICLIDRTVLDTPCVIPAGENGIIEYTLKTDIQNP